MMTAERELGNRPCQRSCSKQYRDRRQRQADLLGEYRAKQHHVSVPKKELKGLVHNGSDLPNRP